MSEPAFSREALLRGSPSRRATTLLLAIEGRTARLAERSRTAMARYLTERQEAERERAFLGALADARSDVAVRPQQLERYADRWSSLVPRDADTVASLAGALLAKYTFRHGDCPRLRAALRLEDEAVVAAYTEQLGRPLDTAFTRALPRRERWRWWRSRMEIRLETLPPTWTAFALTLTETIGVGILALPIAFAAAGPAAATALLVVFGVINILTVAALVESITRSGTMRFGAAYLGRFVGAYFGRSGNATVSVALLLLNVIGLGILILGFGTTVASITGVSPVLWAMVLAVAIILILRRESLDATVASVLLVGGLNIALLLVVVALSATAFDSDNLSDGFAGAETPAVAGLLFGTALMAFFGHTSAGNAAKVVLARDPSGRSLLRGNVMAIAMALLLNIAFVLAVLGAVPADELIGFSGTALTPLVDHTGPLVASLGLAFVALSMGLSSLHMSLSLYNQVGERLPRPGTATASRVAVLLADPRARAVAKASPVVILLAIVEVMLLTDSGSFTDSVNFVGTVTLPLLAGLFPMMLLVAARRRGEYVPGRTTGALGHPLVAGALAAFFLAGLLAHAFVIWTEPVQQAAALVAAGAMVAVALQAVREQAFERRTVIELRVDAGRPDTARAGVVVAGEHAGIPIGWSSISSTSDGHDELDLGQLDAGGQLRVELPASVPRAARVWVHRVDEEGVSGGWPVSIELRTADDRYPLSTDGDGVLDRALPPGDASVVITGSSRRGGPYA